ncbi:hypothetical protein [Streptomyces sp. ALI-76-A]|uniref:hypothetical protein n=1 Tax=Streptomyces sp. ALI-76-A TaxID=3025736 RepID=UPI00256EF236|nr:hypothetical protein [Streptomyces sp. ALI-76-A]MDL5199662.1 hypothetical protein [Streptomyces sp. ALI-76-A]
MRRCHEQIDDASTRGNDPDLDAEVRGIFEASGLGHTPPVEVEDLRETGGDPRKQIVFEIVLKSGENGIGPEAIRDVIARLHPTVTPPHAATIGK